MTNNLVPFTRMKDSSFRITRALPGLTMLLWFGTILMAQNSNSSTLHVTHVLGFEGISNNVNGDLSIKEQTLHFQAGDGRAAQISVGSIQDVSLGQAEKQVGGTPMLLGKAATPFGGGRVISLFSHKKYDTVTVEYMDADGGLHGAIFQLKKGEAEILKNELQAAGAAITQPEEQPVKQSSQETNNESN